MRLPLASGGLGAGAALAFARGIGEFGATIMFAGSLQGVTQTLSLAVYQEFDVDFDTALAIGALLVIVSAVVLFAAKLIVPVWRRSGVDLDHGLRSFRLSVALEVGRETVALVGPSGAGKTSVLRAIAGLLRPERGVVVLRRDDVARHRSVACDLPPEQPPGGARVPGVRALSAHERAGERRVRRARARGRAARALRDRPPRQARGLRRSPEASASGSRSRERSHAIPRCFCSTSRSRHSTPTRVHECGSSCGSCSSELALPTLMVTHDFDDAAALADRVGVLVDGRLLQVGAPSELVAAPADAFVAGFTGANLLRGVASEGPDGLTAVALEAGFTAYTVDSGEGHVALAVYPWEVSHRTRGAR